MKKVKEVVFDFAEEVVEKPIRIIGIEQEQEGWLVTVEVPEETDYARKFALDEQIGIYEIELDHDLEVLAFERESIRSRGKIEGETGA